MIKIKGIAKQIVKTNRQYLMDTRLLHIPSSPTWELMPVKKQKEIKIDFKKLELLSMLSIDRKIEKYLGDAIGVVERMCEVATCDIEPLNQFKYLGSCELRKDCENFESVKFSDETKDARQKRIVSNSSYNFDGYFVAPPSKYS